MRDWMEWNGGECPVFHGTRVDVKFRDGVNAFDLKAGYTIDKYPKGHGGRAATEWIHHGRGSDIIAYRLAGLVAETAQQMAQKQRDERVSEPVSIINIDDALDELSEMMQFWINNRQNGRTPRHVKTAILSMIKEIAAQ